MAFADSFTFTRASTGAYLDASGNPQVAAVGVARFDHLADGTSLGLLMQGQPETGTPDQVAAIDTGWGAVTSTILHEHMTPEGLVMNRAMYSATPLAAVNGLLRTKGWHRRITVVPALLNNVNGQVSYAGKLWTIYGLIQAAAGVVIGPSSTTAVREA